MPSPTIAAVSRRVFPAQAHTTHTPHTHTHRAILIAAVILPLLLAGCGDYWESQANANVARAEAARANSRAAIIQAEGGKALDLAQAAAIGQLADANVQVMDKAIGLAAGNQAVSVAVLAFLAFVAFAMFVIWQVLRTRRLSQPYYQPPPQPTYTMIDTPRSPDLRIELPNGRRIVVLANPDDTRNSYLLDVREIQALLGEQGPVKLLPPGR